MATLSMSHARANILWQSWGNTFFESIVCRIDSPLGLRCSTGRLSVRAFSWEGASSTLSERLFFSFRMPRLCFSHFQGFKKFFHAVLRFSDSRDVFFSSKAWSSWLCMGFPKLSFRPKLMGNVFAPAANQRLLSETRFRQFCQFGSQFTHSHLDCCEQLMIRETMDQVLQPWYSEIYPWQTPIILVWSERSWTAKNSRQQKRFHAQSF